MSNLFDKDYRTMLGQFRPNDLKALLEAFGQNNTGNRTELRELACELLSSNRPTDLNIEAYVSKITEIYNLLPFQQSYRSDNDMMPLSRLLMLELTENYQLEEYHQQSMYMPQARGICGNSTGANTIRGNTMANNHTSVPSHQVRVNYKFKNKPFYDVIENIIKPTFLDGSDKFTSPNFVKGTKECTFVHTMTNEQVNLIASNRGILFGKTVYVYEYQIRICQLDNGECDEVTDDLPIGLHIRVGKLDCTLPPVLKHNRSRMKGKRAAEPINITRYLKLSPFHPNIITINWIPDGKKYALAMFIVKQLSLNTLMKKLFDKNLRSSEGTKNDIIKMLTNFDSDLTATSSYTFSLICPLSKVRMKIPAKSIHCDHIQCFDAGTFILLNEKMPKWMCPICNKSCLYEDIQIQNYFFEIIRLLTLREEVNVIEILADGSWIIPEENKDAKNMNITINNKEKYIGFIDLDDIVDEKCVELRKEHRPGGLKCQESENLKPHLIDITMDEDEEQSKQKD